MFLAVPSRRLGIALNLEAVPIRPLDAEDISAAPVPKPPLLDIGRLDGGRDISMVQLNCEIQQIKFFVFSVACSTVDMETLIFIRTGYGQRYE